MAEATAQLAAEHPASAPQLAAYYGRFQDMLGVIPGSVAILQALRAAGHPLYALTNWSHETFPHALRTFDFLPWSIGIVVSGAEKTRKPFPAIYQTLLHCYGLAPRGTVFIDDSPANVQAASALGMRGILFHSPEQLRQELVANGLLR